MEMLIILALAFGAMYLLTSRTRKQQREAADFRANLEVGQEVMTGSGLYGTIVDVDGDIITLESTPGNHTRWIRAAIAKEVTPTDGAPLDDEEYADEADDEYADEYAGEYADEADVAATDDDADATAPRRTSGATAAGATAAGPRGTGDLTHDSIDVPDDLSTLDQRRTDDGTDRR